MSLRVPMFRGEATGGQLFMTAPRSLSLVTAPPAGDQPETTYCILPAAVRGMGIFMGAPKGSGKSRFLGRALAWQDFMHSVPLVILDPVGGTIDNFLDKLRREPIEEQKAYWPRVR